MDKIYIDILKSFNDIKFGVSREELWKKIGKPQKSFYKNAEDKIETDDYGIFHIFYDEDYRFEAIEIFNDIDIYCNNNKLSKKYSEILEYFSQIYDDIEEDEYGFITLKGSVGFYIENDEGLVDSILFGKENYYNE